MSSDYTFSGLTIGRSYRIKLQVKYASIYEFNVQVRDGLSSVILQADIFAGVLNRWQPATITRDFVAVDDTLELWMTQTTGSLGNSDRKSVV